MMDQNDGPREHWDEYEYLLWDFKNMAPKFLDTSPIERWISSSFESRQVYDTWINNT